MKIAYEKHPVTAERKAEIRAQGLKIVDVAFAPKGEQTAEPTGSDGDEKVSGSARARRQRGEAPEKTGD